MTVPNPGLKTHIPGLGADSTPTSLVRARVTAELRLHPTVLKRQDALCTAVFRTIYVWRREYAPADASAGRSATACAVTLYTSGAATARIAERSLGARSLCMGTGPSRRLR